MRKSKFFVIVQFICIILLLKEMNLPAFSILSIFHILAILLGISALYQSQKTNFSIFPEVKEHSQLVKSGPYRFIRHPMYSSILLFFLPLLISQFSVYVLAIYIILSIDLLLKLWYEESLLKIAFTDYSEYQKTTAKLIPFVF